MGETEQVGGAGMQRAAEAGAGLAGGGPTEKALAMAAATRERLMAMPAGKRTWLIASGVFLAAICAGMIWFAGRQDWRVLFGGAGGEEVEQGDHEKGGDGVQYEARGVGVRRYRAFELP